MRISYWCGWLDPQMVAVSKEVFQLMDYFPRSYAFGLGPNHYFSFSRRKRSVGINTRAYPVVRYLLPLIERRFDVSHVYTSLADWHYLNALGARPIVLTLTQRGRAAFPELLKKVCCVAAESEALARSAVEAGVPPERVRVVYPGVDFGRFRNTMPPSSPPWKMLFASSPESAEEIHTKGLDLLLALARETPELELTVLWRPFGPASDEACRQVEELGLPNVRNVRGRIANMESYYEQSHMVVAPFRTVGKPCPNSVLEGLACGRPVLVSSFVDIRELVERDRCGVGFEPTIEGIRNAFSRLVSSYCEMRTNARPCAERHFDLTQTRLAYRAIYEKVLAAA